MKLILTLNYVIARVDSLPRGFFSMYTKCLKSKFILPINKIYYTVICVNHVIINFIHFDISLWNFQLSPKKSKKKLTWDINIQISMVLYSEQYFFVNGKCIAHLSYCIINEMRTSSVSEGAKIKHKIWESPKITHMPSERNPPKFSN